MKTYPFLLIILLMSVFASGQTISLNELTKIIPMSWDDFDTYALSKKYYFNNNDVKEDFHQIIYEWDGTKSKGERYLSRAAIWGGIYDSEDNPYEILANYTTRSSAEYLSIKSQVKAQGYKLINSENKENRVWLVYEKGDFEVTLVSRHTRLSSGAETDEPSYEICISKKSNKYLAPPAR